MTTPPSSLPTIDGTSSDSWSALQLIIVGLCVAVNMIDGMDVLILSYIAPALQLDWNVPADEVGVLFSAGILGMAIGGLAIAPVADFMGRRRLILLSLLISTIGMIASAFAGSIGVLMLLRVLVGCGIGAVLASMAALIAEYAPPRHRSFAIGLMYGGYPLGAILTGFAAAHAIPLFGWQLVLGGAGAISALMIPVLLLLLPESMVFLTKRRPAKALDKVNAIRARLRLAPLDDLPRIEDEVSRGGVAGLFSDGRASGTLLLWLAMIFGFAALWFAISWTPKLAIMSGLDQTAGIYAGTFFNFGAFAGTVALGLVTVRFRLQSIIPLFLIAAAGAMLAFGMLELDEAGLFFVSFLIGFLLQGGFNGIYPLAAQLYPAEIRSTGIGWTTGVGRLGAVLGPLLGGILIAREVPLAWIFFIFAVPAVLGGLCAWRVKIAQTDQAHG